MNGNWSKFKQDYSQQAKHHGIYVTSVKMNDMLTIAILPQSSIFKIC